MLASSTRAEPTGVGQDMYALMAELFPIHRSMTGAGLRQSLAMLQRDLPLQIREVPSGTPVFDWTVPDEWNVRDAYVLNARGEKVIDWRVSNLHLVAYSLPTRQTVSLAELKSHLFSLPDHPDWIPYRTSYFQESWGFCLSHRAWQALEDSQYQVVIDTTLQPGSLSYGEYYLPGETDDEVLISCHSCHPSMANDNLSGMVLAAYLARQLSQAPHRYSYRFLFIPGTIGAITWLALNEHITGRIKHGLVVACVGDGGPVTYKKSRRGDAEIDHAAAHVLETSGQPYSIVDFSPEGSDERQYCSPGFDLPVGSLTRSTHGTYPEFHTSADDLSFVSPEALADSLAKYQAVIDVLEGNLTYLNTHPKGEPRLGVRGLFRPVSGPHDPNKLQLALLWVLNLSDGQHSLLDIATRAGLAFRDVRQAADRLLEARLLQLADQAQA